MATITTSGFSAPSIAGYSSIQLKTSGRARPVPERKAFTMRRFLSPAAWRISVALKPTAIMESPASATTRGLPGSTGVRGVKAVARGRSARSGVCAPGAFRNGL